VKLSVDLINTQFGPPMTLKSSQNGWHFAGFGHTGLRRRTQIQKIGSK